MLKKHKKIIALILVLVCIYAVDFTLVYMNKKPIFVIHRGIIKDGGTIEYYGLGYKVIRWHKIASEKIDGKEKRGVLVGDDLSIFPFYQKVNDGPIAKLKFIPIESLNE